MKKLIAGVDPGSVLCGFALLEHLPQERKIIVRHIETLGGKLRHHKYEQRIYRIAQQLDKRLEHTWIYKLAIEYFYVQKKKNYGFGVYHHANGVLCGVAMTSLLHHDNISYFTAPEARKIVMGNGRLTKHKTHDMLRAYLGYSSLLTGVSEDALDAIVVALAQVYSMSPSYRTHKISVEPEYYYPDNVDDDIWLPGRSS